jgi:TPP-dependent pyruvate/acetoin dehydrogenase alpha subunit
MGHHVGDVSREYYRSKDEERLWKTDRDPLRLLTNWLAEERHVETSIFDQIEREVRTEVEAGVQFALTAPFPTPDEVSEDVYV